jgi:hypothetical protein
MVMRQISIAGALCVVLAFPVLGQASEPAAGALKKLSKHVPYIDIVEFVARLVDKVTEKSLPAATLSPGKIAPKRRLYREEFPIRGIEEQTSVTTSDPVFGVEIPGRRLIAWDLPVINAVGAVPATALVLLAMVLFTNPVLSAPPHRVREAKGSFRVVQNRAE